MSNTKTAAHKVPFGQKVAFGLGMLANQMFPAALGIFMVVLVQDLGFPGWMWGILFFLRVGKEEQLMVETFGDDYRSYMKRTKRVVPLIY